jgi:hypothetical protein
MNVRFVCAVTVGAITLGMAATAQKPATMNVQVNGNDKGRIFQGIGALSAGASSRLLIDYPPLQRQEILDYLFKPQFGASLQINKVEIGGDMNSTDGSEPSAQRTASDHDFHRGYEWWLMKQSRLLNPKIKLYGLEWGAPGWVNPYHQDTWTDKNIRTIINWVNHAKLDYGLTINYLGGWNERGLNTGWYEAFRKALNRAGLSKIQVVADDSWAWNAASTAASDSAFRHSFNIVGVHYPAFAKLGIKGGEGVALSLKKPVWESEMGSQPYDTGAPGLARSFNDGYISGRITAYINWSTIWSVYGGLPYTNCGLMLANEPWSGHYVVGPSIWTVAQTTQFVQPGWQYLDGACQYVDGNPADGSCVALKSPNGNNYSMIFETVAATRAVTFHCNVSGGLSTASLYCRSTDLNSTNSKSWFVRRPDIKPVAGSFTVTLKPGEVVSVSTLGGQHHGRFPVPDSRVLTRPYHENFQEYALGSTPRLFSDQQGTFDIAKAQGGRSGKCLRQEINTAPIFWDGDGDPSTVVGDWRWRNYTVASDVLVEQPGYVDLVGRMQNTYGMSNVISGYHLRISTTGKWELLSMKREKSTLLASGTGSYPAGTWHRLKLRFSLNTITAWIDGRMVVKGLQNDAYAAGLAGYQVSRWCRAEFQNFVVTKVKSPTIALQGLEVSATSFEPTYTPSMAIDGSTDTFWHAQFTPTVSPLPQSITVKLPKAMTVEGLTYLPRQDGNSNGDITQYVVSVSSDGRIFTPVAQGTWPINTSLKVVRFSPKNAHWIRLTAIAGVSGYASAAEIQLIHG